MQLERLIAINSDFQLQWEDKQDCFVLLYPEGMVQLNQSAGEILNLCDGSLNTTQIIRTLEEKFSIMGLKGEVVAFLEEAMNRNWVKYND